MSLGGGEGPPENSQQRKALSCCVCHSSHNPMWVMAAGSGSQVARPCGRHTTRVACRRGCRETSPPRGCECTVGLRQRSCSDPVRGVVSLEVPRLPEHGLKRPGSTFMFAWPWRHTKAEEKSGVEWVKCAPQAHVGHWRLTVNLGVRAHTDLITCSSIVKVHHCTSCCDVQQAAGRGETLLVHGSRARQHSSGKTHLHLMPVLYPEACPPFTWEMTDQDVKVSCL